MKKIAVLIAMIVSVSIFAPEAKATASWQYSVTQTEQIAFWNGQPVYGTVKTVYSVDIYNQITVVSKTVVGPPTNNPPS